MSLVPMVELLRAARQAGCAVGAFNVITLECGEAIRLPPSGPGPP